VLALAIGSITSGCGANDDASDGANANRRARELIASMSLEQKISQTHGTASEEDFRIVPGIAALGIPDLTVTNGPAGVGPGPAVLSNVPATALPSPLLLASTWDPVMAKDFGDVQGLEMRAIGRNLIEAPAVDLARVPITGRTFEGYGEDPELISRLAVANIRAIQSHGVLAMVKHYAANNQELNRLTIDAQVSERTLRELYLAPFEAAVVSGEVSSVMCSYNLLNGAHSCENSHLLNDILKGDWDFAGFVQSDFFAARSTVGSALAGMDLEMPSAEFFGAPLLAAIQRGEVTESRLDDMLMRRFREMIRHGLFEREPATSPIPAAQHAAVARRIGAAGTVLLRNHENILPLAATAPSRIAVLGPWASRVALGGGGSSMVNPIRQITPLDGIAQRLVGTSVEVIDGAGRDKVESARLASAADTAIVVVGNFESEGFDRETLALPDDQDALIRAIAAANPRTVVVVHAGAPVLMPWVNEVAAIVEGWYPGGEDGHTTAAVLFGDVNPSGKLPITFPASDDQGPTGTPERYPGIDGKAHYDEGLEVGYRWYQANGQTPLFPFGFGLSYTTFRLEGLELSRVRLEPGQSTEVTVRVTNTGARTGAEVVQVYVAYPPSLGEPPRQLRSFARVELAAGESRRVSLPLAERALAVWDANDQGWVVRRGSYGILVGTSSEDTPLSASLTVR